MKKYVVILIFACMIPISVGILCYSCSDSSGDEGKNHCQAKLKLMSKERSEHADDTKKSPWLKNCTHPNQTFCIIEKIESSGRVFSFMRECSDGVTFSFKKADVRTLQTVRPDNQTACGYIQSGFSICLTLCDTDFCNGPSSSSTLLANTTLILLSLLFLVLCAIRNMIM